jgi:hypothetical protein
MMSVTVADRSSARRRATVVSRLHCEFRHNHDSCYMNTPTSAKSGRSKPRRSQGFIPELNAIPDGKRPQNDPITIESTAPAKRGAAVFRLEMPTAQTVKLAADFTGWDKNPLDLSPSGNGIWKITVALPPGRYAYRFLVDGEWHDDPQCVECEPNPFGTANAVAEVT